MSNRKRNILFVILGLFMMFLYLDKTKMIDFVTNFYTSIIPFFYAIVIVYILNPFIKYFDKILSKYISIKKSHIVSIVLAYAIFCLFIYLSITSIIPIITMNITNLIDNFPEISKVFITNFESFFAFIDENILITIERGVQEYIDNFSIDSLAGALPVLYNTSSYIFNIIYNIFVAFIISLYLIFEKDQALYYLKRVIRAIIGQNAYDLVIKVSEESYRMFNTYMVGKIKDSLIIGILLFIIMKICKLDYAVLLSIIVGFTNMIPYIGPFIGGIVGVFLLLSISLNQAIWFFVIIVILQQLDCWVIGVIVIEDETGMSPLLILMSVIIGGAVAGWIGMLIGTPIAQIITYIIDLCIEHQEDKQKLKIEDI